MTAPRVLDIRYSSMAAPVHRPRAGSKVLGRDAGPGSGASAYVAGGQPRLEAALLAGEVYVKVGVEGEDAATHRQHLEVQASGGVARVGLRRSAHDRLAALGARHLAGGEHGRNLLITSGDIGMVPVPRLAETDPPRVAMYRPAKRMVRFVTIDR